MKTIEEILAFNLTELRKAAGFKSRQAFAEASGLPFPTYRDIEEGRSWPERKNIAAIARTLDVPETRLFADPEYIPTPTNKDILDAISVALMERDMLRNLQKQGIVPKAGSPQWNEMLRAGLANRPSEETEDLAVAAEAPFTGKKRDLVRALSSVEDSNLDYLLSIVNGMASAASIHEENPAKKKKSSKL